MDAKTPRFRVRAQILRIALYGASALVLLAAVALPVGYSPSSMEPFQNAAHAKGGGPGGGGPPDHSNAGGGGKGNSNVTSTSHGDGEEEDPAGKDKLGKLNAANAANAAFIHANANSTVGQIAIYKQRVEDEEITTFDDANTFLETFTNKLVTEGVVAALNELLGLAPFVEESGDPAE